MPGSILRDMWHDFYACDEANHQCVDCDVIVDNAVIDELTLACPVALCEDPTNRGEPCVFVPAEEGSVCAYCERFADLEQESEAVTVP